MSAFRTKLRFEDDGGFPFVLLEPLVYDSDGLGRTITVPTGFKTDLCSIPALFDVVIPRIGGYDEGSVLHDAAYQAGFCTWTQADALLFEAMGIRVLNPIPAWKRWAIWAGLRAGGWVQWNKYRHGHWWPQSVDRFIRRVRHG